MLHRFQIRALFMSTCQPQARFGPSKEHKSRSRRLKKPVLWKDPARRKLLLSRQATTLRCTSSPLKQSQQTRNAGFIKRNILSNGSTHCSASANISSASLTDKVPLRRRSSFGNLTGGPACRRVWALRWHSTKTNQNTAHGTARSMPPSRVTLWMPAP